MHCIKNLKIYNLNNKIIKEGLNNVLDKRYYAILNA